MFRLSLHESQLRQKELQQQAAHYRLTKSLSRPAHYGSRLLSALGRMLIITGEGLINRTQTAH